MKLSEFTSNAGEAFASLTDLVEYYMENKDLLKTNEGEKVSSFVKLISTLTVKISFKINFPETESSAYFLLFSKFLEKYFSKVL